MRYLTNFAAGLVFALAGISAADADPSFSTIYQFPGGASGYGPEYGVIPGPNGSLYGTTDRGGTNDGGVVYQLLPSTVSGQPWKQRVVFRFASFDQGGYPLGLALARNGDLYGVTLDGGTGRGASGTAFKLAHPTAAYPSWTFTSLHSFLGGYDGAEPTGSPLIDVAGTVTGATLEGGTSPAQEGNGMIFRLLPPSSAGGVWSERVLHRFGGSPDGALPSGTLLGEGQTLRYGTTSGGGTGVCSDIGCGTVYQFAFTPSGPVAYKIYDFQGGPDGSSPVDRLIADKNGSLYGVTANGGLPGSDGHFNTGTVFRLDPPASMSDPWTKTVLYQFAGGTDGYLPEGGLVMDAAGALYGTTEFGGAHSAGTVFKLVPATVGGTWTKTIIHSFGSNALDGFDPIGPLNMASTGAIYGTTYSGGYTSDGTVFQIVP